MIYAVLEATTRVALHLFFRRIDVEGGGRVPAGRPVLLLPNHANSLVDALVVASACRRPVTLTAKSVLAHQPLLGAIMRSAGIIWFHRRQDIGKGAVMAENLRSLERCRRVLAAGGAVCIFPEGASHSEPRMRPFRTGAARIAIDYATLDGNPGGLAIVPVGLLYSEKNRFRSTVWLRFGAPLDVGDWLAAHPPDPALLTAEVRARVEALTIEYASRSDSVLLEWAAALVSTHGSAPPTLGTEDDGAAERFRLLALLRREHQRLASDHPGEVAALSTRIRKYAHELRMRGVEPGEVYLPMHAGRALLFAIREAELLLVGGPVALLGAVAHGVPYFLVATIARALSKERDEWASNTVLPAAMIFPAWYAGVLGTAWWFLPRWWALLVTVALPYSGYYALLYRDRVTLVWRRLRTFVQFLFDRPSQDRLASEGRAILKQMFDLAQAPGEGGR